MPHYKDPENKLYWLDSADFEQLLPTGCVQIGDAEAESITLAAQEAAAALTPEQIFQVANTRRDDLLAMAALRIAPLQDAVDLGVATADDTANLTLWKQYRVAVNRVSTQADFPTTIDWPVSPT